MQWFFYGHAVPMSTHILVMCIVRGRGRSGLVTFTVGTVTFVVILYLSLRSAFVCPKSGYVCSKNGFYCYCMLFCHFIFEII